MSDAYLFIVSGAELCNYFPLVCLRFTVQYKHSIANEVVIHISVHCDQLYASFTKLYLHLLSITTTRIMTTKE